MEQNPQDFERQPSFDYETERRRAAVARDFTTPAVLTLVLYLVLYIPGLVANIIYLYQANEVKNLTGHSPGGQGCLVALLVVFLALPVVGCGCFFLFGALGTATAR